ncbi:MAG: sugar ABC transporter substrate-binding protein [Carbonactinosporaceae bacterium]
MREGMPRTIAFGAAAVLGLAACGQGGGGQGTSEGGAGKIGVILPDTKSSARWETADRKYLGQAFEAAGVAYDIQNAQGDKQQFQTIADQMITKGVTVLMIVNLDSGTGSAVIKKAESQGVATIDYDRLTLGGGAEYYVSFDNTRVGELQGRGLARCLGEQGVPKPTVAELNGAPTDNNATLFKNGYDSVLGPKYQAGDYAKGPDQWVPDWDNQQAGTIFEQMLTKEPGIDGVLAANDGLANSVIAILKKNRLNGEIPVTGQDATLQGLQHILNGDQCMTVYKAIKKEADAAARLAVSLLEGKKGKTNGTVFDPESKRKVPSVLLEPVAIFRDDIDTVVEDGFVAKEDLCAGGFAAMCAEAGIG